MKFLLSLSFWIEFFWRFLLFSIACLQGRFVFFPVQSCPGGSSGGCWQGGSNPPRAGASPNTFQRRRCARQTKLIQECHAEPIRFAQGKLREGSLSGERSFAALRMTKRAGLFFEMYWGQAPRAGASPVLRGRVFGERPPIV